MVRPRHQLKVGNATDLSTGILTAAAHALKDGETAVLQWIITPTAGNSEFSIIGALLGREENPDDIKDRQTFGRLRPLPHHHRAEEARWAPKELAGRKSHIVPQ